MDEIKTIETKVKAPHSSYTSQPSVLQRHSNRKQEQAFALWLSEA
jgi:hypothetical protein